MSKPETAMETRLKLFSRIARAVLITAATGVVWLILWLLTSFFSAGFPQYSELFETFAWAMLFFVFVTTLSEGTIYKYVFIIIRAFFVMVYMVYATNFGLLSLSFEGFTITVEFMPLIALIVLADILDVARGLLQAIEFASQSPRD
ncbi:MAG: hypothetical protein RMJ15_04525 [Nitrososphaerota archaeon]|nr:hypothetical protein [Candidatus Bathyarchaeota archaeon]MDW8022987.1 hypothetical protein [Nitrososphaerota archaeon]